MSQRKRIRRLVAVMAAMAGVLLVSSASAHGTATVTIQHKVHGCHAWSYNNGAYKATLNVQLRRGELLTIRNNDVMPHKLVRHIRPGAQGAHAGDEARLGASARVRFTKAGVYKLQDEARRGLLMGLAHGDQGRGQRASPDRHRPLISSPGRRRATRSSAGRPPRR